jgi:hypothetical protein
MDCLTHCGCMGLKSQPMTAASGNSSAKSIAHMPVPGAQRVGSASIYNTEFELLSRMKRSCRAYNFELFAELKVTGNGALQNIVKKILPLPTCSEIQHSLQIPINGRKM